MSTKSLASTVVHEAVASLIWLYLDLPDDASREEVEGYAGGLIARIREGTTPEVLAREIQSLQVARLCRDGDQRAIRTLAERCTATCTRFSFFEQRQ